MTTLTSTKRTYVTPNLVEYGSIVALTGACDGPCVDGIPGGMEEGL
jgi:hypothetical protein